MKRHASSRTMRRPWLRFGIGLFPILLSACAAREVRVVCQVNPPPPPLMEPPPGADVPVEVGRDIAVELYRLADEADALSARLRALQDYSRAVSAPPP